MKKILSMIICLCMLAGMFVFPSGASAGGVKSNPRAELPFGELDITGELDENEYCTALDFDDNTVGYFWSNMQLTTNAKLYFRASETGLYFAADIFEETAMGNSYVPSTGYDNINNEGNKRPYGFNGDVMTLMIDPLGILEKTPYQNTAWYNVAVYEDGSAHMYRSRVNEKDITDEVRLSGGIKQDTDGWYFQSFIPWEIIIEDTLAIYPSADISVESIVCGAVSRAAVMYMDRYKSQNATNTWGRFITVCESTYDGYYGTSTSGPVAKAFGLKLNIDRTNSHTWGEWVSVSEATCTDDGEMKRVCHECGKEETKTVPAPGHDWTNWVTVKEPTETENGLKRRICNRCQSADERVLAYTEQEPQVVVYYNSSVSTNSYEFTSIDVVNYHPAQVTQAAGYPNNPVKTTSLSNLDFIRNKARNQNPDIKFTVAVANENLSVFESWLKTETYRKQLASYLVDIVADHELDGLDIDYEFPTSQNLRDDFVAFAAELRSQLDNLSYETGRELSFSLAVPAGQWAFSLFDIENLAQYVSWFNIMSYDLYCGSNYPLTHHHTPAYDNSVYPGGSVASDIALYISRGIAKDKIVVGAGMYARRWNGVESSGDGLYCNGTVDESNIHYSDIRSSYVNKNGFVRYWDDNAKAPYLYNKETKVFISYDDEESVAAKCDLVLTNGIRGIMVFDYVTCDGCGFFEQLDSFLDSTTGNHIWGTWTVTKNPTCTEKGQKKRVCSCGEIEYSDIAELGHDLETEWITIPTAASEGSYRKACRRCGEEFAPVSTALSVDSYWDVTSSGGAFINRNGDLAVTGTDGRKINPFAKAVSKYSSSLDGFVTTVTPGYDTDSLCLFWTTAQEWYDDENEWSVPSIGTGAGNYRYGNIRSTQAANEYTYSIVFCDYLDLGWYTFPGSPDDGVYDVVVSHTVSSGNFWGSTRYDRTIPAGEPLTVELFNHYDEDEGGWILGFIVNGDWFYDTNCNAAFSAEGRNDGYYFGVLSYSEGSGTANAVFAIDSIGDDDTTIDFMGTPFTEHTHSFSEWYTVVRSSCLYRGVEKRTCTCGCCEKNFLEKGDHLYGDWVLVKSASETEPGRRERTCSVCGNIESEEIPAADVSPMVTAKRHMVTVTHADTLDYIRIAEGSFVTAGEIKSADGLVQLNERMISSDTSSGKFTRLIEKSGEYTFWLRAKDGRTYIQTVTVSDPEQPLAQVTADGLRINITGLDEARTVRTAYGEYSSVREIKNGEYYRGFTSKHFDDDALTVYCSNDGGFGKYTVCITYSDGYNEYHYVTVAKKTAEYSVNGNAVTFTVPEGLVRISYAPGEYNSYSEIKNSPRNRVVKPSAEYGNAVICYMESGIYSAFVQFDDGSSQILMLSIG